MAQQTTQVTAQAVYDTSDKYSQSHNADISMLDEDEAMDLGSAMTPSQMITPQTTSSQTATTSAQSSTVSAQTASHSTQPQTSTTQSTIAAQAQTSSL